MRLLKRLQTRSNGRLADAITKDVQLDEGGVCERIAAEADGAAMVRRFANSDATVAFTYSGSHAAAAALANEVGAEAIKADSADRQAVIGVVQSRGALDVLVVNAGVIIFGDARTLDPDAVDHLIDVNVRAPYHASVEAAKRMNAGGRIILIGSVNGDRMAFPGAAAYALSKSALQGMARGLARDLGDRGITVNVVQPGPVDTDMNPADGPISAIVPRLLTIPALLTRTSTAPRPARGARTSATLPCSEDSAWQRVDDYNARGQFSSSSGDRRS